MIEKTQVAKNSRSETQKRVPDEFAPRSQRTEPAMQKSQMNRKMRGMSTLLQRKMTNQQSFYSYNSAINILTNTHLNEPVPLLNN